MPFSYQFGANPPIDVPRFLIADTADQGHIFEDSEILMAANLVSPAFSLTSFGGGQAQIAGAPSYRYIAAALLEVLAASKARLAAALRVLDIQIDPSKAAQELREQAKALRTAEQEDGSFAIAEMSHDQFAMRERVWKQLLRLQA